MLIGGFSPDSQASFRALSGPEAAQVGLPSDVTLIHTLELPAYGLTYERYQQVVGNANAAVLGGQLTILRDDSGTAVAVIGAHFPSIQPTNEVNLTSAQARERAAQDHGSAGIRDVRLRLNPNSGRHFYQVETNRGDSRWIHWIDTGSGVILNKFNALTDSAWGYGTLHSNDNPDVKDLTSLTTLSSGSYFLLSQDGRQETHNQGSTNRPFLGPIATDSDDAWDIIGRVSPGQQALVDAHYYAAVTDAYLSSVHSYDWIAEATAANGLTTMEVQAHFFRNYNNAFWNGDYVAFGDGDGGSYAEFTSLDVVGHELAHGVTEFTSNLVYQNESGALNEAFSDIIGTSLEFYAEAAGKEPSALREPDFLIGEDFDLRGDTEPGIRNMADPGEDGDPSHYADRYTGSSDNGGVHINSGIANHWFYLLVNGGQNAAAARASGTDVQGIGLAAAERIAFLGFASLAETSTYCDVRQATIAVAGADQANVSDAWDEVGVDGTCGTSSPNNPPTADFSSQVDGLSVSLTDASSDGDGSIVSWNWDFGDTNTSTAQNPSHSYATAATYSVELTVTDNEGAVDSMTKDITVEDSNLSGIALSVRPFKVKGVQHVELTWSGTNATSVDVYRDSALIATTSNTGSYTENLGVKGGGDFYDYQVCETGGGDCSNTDTAVF
jgi:Zn-dependent metalloprotease